MDKLQESYARQPGQNDNDVVPARVPRVEGLGDVEDIATKGKQASQWNVGKNPTGTGGSLFKGDRYYTPDSVTESSRETEGSSQR